MRRVARWRHGAEALDDALGSESALDRDQRVDAVGAEAGGEFRFLARRLPRGTNVGCAVAGEQMLRQRLDHPLIFGKVDLGDADQARPAEAGSAEEPLGEGLALFA